MEKVDYKHGRFVLVDTDPLQFEYESYEDFCEINGMEPQGEDSTDFLDWCYEESANQFNEDMDNIRCCEEYNVPCLINGSLGLWWGNPTVTPVRCESVYDAIKRCICGNYDKEVEVAYDDGKIEVKVAHHDGTNVFTITALSKKGISKVGDDYKPHDTKRLPYIYAIGI